MRVTLFTRNGCSLCESARDVLDRVRTELPFELEVIDIDADRQVWERYRYDIPVVAIEGEQVFIHRVDERELRRRLAQGGRGER